LGSGLEQQTPAVPGSNDGLDGQAARDPLGSDCASTQDGRTLRSGRALRSRARLAPRVRVPADQSPLPSHLDTYRAPGLAESSGRIVAEPSHRKIGGPAHQVFGRPAYRFECREGSNTVLLFDARVDEETLQVAVMIRDDDEGRVAELTVMMRPLSVVRTFAAIMESRLGQLGPLRGAGRGSPTLSGPMRVPSGSRERTRNDTKRRRCTRTKTRCSPPRL
jgi:hypothetical protein